MEKVIDSNDIKCKIFDSIQSLVEDASFGVTDNTQIIGSEGVLDSMRLVELCLKLEDLGEEIGFDFDWASNATLSRSRSMFRTAKTLSDEFLTQMQNKL